MNNKIICIDAGHGGYDSGAVNGSRYEKNDNLKFATILKEKLITQGFEVVSTRTEDKAVTLQKRTELANQAKASVYISLHRNAFTNSSACGVENWIYQNADDTTKHLADCVLNELIKVGAQKNRGLKRGNFYVLRETNMPACLLELGFISNQQDNILFDANLEKYATAIAKGICNYFEVSYSEKTKETQYHIQVGTFQNKQNADNLLRELKAKGYPAMIVKT